MPTLKVRLLGPPIVEWEGEYVTIPRRRARALLFRLALDLQPVAREHLVYLFWANRCDDHAHRDLTHLLTHLRRALPAPDIIQTTADFVFLNSHLVSSDTCEFLRCFHGPHVSPTLDLLSEAGALFHGALMDGFALDGCAEFEEWLTIERAVWERRYNAVLVSMERVARERGDLAMAIQCAQHALALDGMDSETHLRLVAARLAAGDDDLVRQRWEAVRTLLEKEAAARRN